MRQLSTFKSKKALVYEHLRAEILRGTFPPGERIVIDGLAVQLGVSQIPIREALQQLEADGFVSMEPHIGPRVAAIEAEGIWEIFQLLEALEIISSRAACQQMTATDFEEMEQLLRFMDALGADVETWAQNNQRFHLAFCHWAKTKLVKNMMKIVLDHWDRLRHYYLKDVWVYRIEQSQQEHWALFEALRVRDPEQAAKVIKQHNQSALHAYVEHLRANQHMPAEAADPVNG
jgi:DNA-binding GntR family transcriptional regulator